MGSGTLKNPVDMGDWFILATQIYSLPCRAPTYFTAAPDDNLPFLSGPDLFHEDRTSEQIST
jgi:hypothetical protein